jgi:hypothetical protein
VHRLTFNRDTASFRPAIFAHCLIVVARNVDEFRASADLEQQLLQDIVMRLWPIHAAPDAPEVDNVADQVNPRCLVYLQEVKQGFSFAGLGSKMDVRKKERSITLHLGVRFPSIFSLSVQHIKPTNKLILYQPCDTSHLLRTTKNRC